MTELQNTLDGLPEQFIEPTAGLNRVQMMYWHTLESSHGAPIKELLNDPTYKVVLALYAEHIGKGQSESRATFLALERARQAFYRACAAESAGRYRANQQTVDDAVLLVIDAEGNALPRAALLDAGVPADEVARVAGKNGSRRKVKKSLQKHAQHPNARRMIQSEGKREYMRMATDTLSGSLEGIAVNMRTQARLARLEQTEADHARRIAELEARLAVMDARHAVDDAGIDPKARALQMRAGGLGYKAIAKALGRSPATVQSWVRRAA